MDSPYILGQYRAEYLIQQRLAHETIIKDNILRKKHAKKTKEAYKLTEKSFKSIQKSE